ncbi:hypothetical protein HYN69_12220 [Gemmobacter aquarius]|uniref:Secreted protein n=1 Tax=Paragemmobacter aquarius TaxID=2169400 RepID=A0A2S0UMY7_9RHOB|nr:hypothetical protein [Gemmobacter aquarius]AWB49167.1 hypothetical protein HYN69_12220 [Gemmobacter aquarius]
MNKFLTSTAFVTGVAIGNAALAQAVFPDPAADPVPTASVSLLEGILADAADLSATAIGSLGSGAMTATIAGQMGAPAGIGSGLVIALVGNN